MSLGYLDLWIASPAVSWDTEHKFLNDSVPVVFHQLTTHDECRLRFFYIEFFFDFCRCPMWILNWVLYKTIWKQCRFHFSFRSN